MGAITIVGQNNFIFSFMSYELMTKSLGVGCTFEVVA
jgi:NADH:ubiquinone oxidoreductase subunit K